MASSDDDAPRLQGPDLAERQAAGERDVLAWILEGVDPVRTHRADQIAVPQVPARLSWGTAGSWLPPPVDPEIVHRVRSAYGDLEPIVNAYVSGVLGAGGRLTPDEGAPDDEVQRGQDWLDDLPEDPETDFHGLLYDTLWRRESGNAYWELRRDEDRLLRKVHLTGGRKIRLTKRDATDVEVTYTNAAGRDVTTYRRFRRYRVLRSGTTGWLKQWTDPRDLSHSTGQARQGNEQPANEILHWRLPGGGDDAYGVPRFRGLLTAMIAASESDDLNLRTIRTMDVPPVVVFLDGKLTKGSLSRLGQWRTMQQAGRTLGAMLILEMRSVDQVTGGKATAMVERLGSEQRDDGAWREFRATTRKRVRTVYRIPPLLLGEEGSYNRATSDNARRSVDEMVFAPDRRPIARTVTRLLREAGFRLTYTLEAPDVTDPSTIERMLTRLTASGGDTPRLVRSIVGSVTGHDLGDDFADGVDPDSPWSGQLAERHVAEPVSVERRDVIEVQSPLPHGQRTLASPVALEPGRYRVGRDGAVVGHLDVGAPEVHEGIHLHPVDFTPGEGAYGAAEVAAVSLD